MPKVSIIVPVYNVEEHLRKCIDSLINQTLRDIEIIIINDGSTDNSQSIIDKYIEQDSRIISIYQENSGLSEARNRGIVIAKGEYIGFVDSDDRIDKNMYHELLHYANKIDADIVGCNYVDEYENGDLSIPRYGGLDDNLSLNEYGRGNFIRDYFINYKFGCEVWSKIFKSDVLKTNQIKFEKNQIIFAEDWLYDLYCFLYLDKIGFINKPFYYHFIRSNSIMHSKKVDLTKRLVTLVEKFIEEAKKAEQYESIKHVVPYIVYHLVTFGLSYAMNLKERIQWLKAIANRQVFMDSMKFIELNSNDIPKKIFSSFCIKKWYIIASFERILVERIVKR